MHIYTTECIFLSMPKQDFLWRGPESPCGADPPGGPYKIRRSWTDGHWIFRPGNVTYRLAPQVPWEQLAKSQDAKTTRPRHLPSRSCARCTSPCHSKLPAQRCGERRPWEIPLRNASARSCASLPTM